MAKFTVAAESMDNETFVRHFNARHVHLPGLATVPENFASEALKSLRAYHERIHKLGHEASDGQSEPTKIEHQHREASTS